MPLTLEELASAIGASLRGDGKARVESCAPIDEAGPRQLSFLANRKYLSHLKTTRAAAVIIGARDVAEAPAHLPLLVADDPYFAFRNAMVQLHSWRVQPAPGISPQAFVDATAVVGELCAIRPFAYIAPHARIGRRCVIYPGCYVGKGATLGDDCVLYPNVVIYDRCVLGDRVTLHAGTVIGQDGFGYATHPDERGEPVHHKIPQAGQVIIEDDVELGANCAVDRATIGVTRIGRGTKTSDSVTIGHGSDVGPHNLLVAQVGIAGSVTTGKYVTMGGQVGVAGHLRIGDRVQIAAKAGVMHDLDAGKTYGGEPAVELSDAKRQILALARLPDLLATLRKLQRRVEALEQQASGPRSD